MNIYSTEWLAYAAESLPIARAFARDRYTETDPRTDIFNATNVFADFLTGNHKLAPFVIPRIGSVTVGRDGYSTVQLEPCNISMDMPITADVLAARGFGEAFGSKKSPAQRARDLIIRDLETMSNMITRSEELLTINTMLNNGCTMQHRTDNAAITAPVEVKYYDGDSNPAEFSPLSSWTHSSKDASGNWTMGSWYTDIKAMISFLVKNGRSARELLCASDVAEFLMNDGWVQSVLDNKRYELGSFKPDNLTEEVAFMGVLNIMGRDISILSYDATYEDSEGQNTKYLPNGSVILTAPKTAKLLYGAVSQVNDAGAWETVPGRRVTQYLATKKPAYTGTVMTARPLVAPMKLNPWAVANHVLGT